MTKAAAQSPYDEGLKDKTMPQLCSRTTVAMLAIAAVAGCTYRGGDIGDPITRKFHWFSFVGGDDIRASCANGTPDRFRLVYNGIYGEQLRIYEVDALRRIVAIHVTDQGNLARFDAHDLAAPWRADEARVQLDEATYGKLVQDFARSGMFSTPPVGLELPSRSYHWTAAMCHDGRYSFTAWKYPSSAFDGITFDDLLFAIDPTGKAVNQPRPVPYDPQWEDRARRNEVTNFTLKVGKNGLVQ